MPNQSENQIITIPLRELTDLREAQMNLIARVTIVADSDQIAEIANILELNSQCFRVLNRLIEAAEK